MKKILITGANSYIGTSFEKYIKENYPTEYVIDTVDMIGDKWKTKDFSGYDTVFHVAGIAHSDTKKASKEVIEKYYRVNTDLAIETAIKAKADGVEQFIFMSSMIVYGESAPIGKTKIITKDTPVAPANFYGDSKVQAEKGIISLEDDSFNVVILRPPMIYGKGSKGNYRLLSKIAQSSPIFPYVKNQRSIIFIYNFTEFVRLMIENEEHGIFLPQNKEYSNTSELVKIIAELFGKRMLLVKGLKWFAKLVSNYTELANKAFGNMCYEHNASEYKEEYIKYDLYQSIKLTEIE